VSSGSNTNFQWKRPNSTSVWSERFETTSRFSLSGPIPDDDTIENYCICSYGLSFIELFSNMLMESRYPDWPWFYRIHWGLDIRIVRIQRDPPPFGDSLSEQILSKLIQIHSPPSLLGYRGPRSEAPRYPNFDSSYPNLDTKKTLLLIARIPRPQWNVLFHVLGFFMSVLTFLTYPLFLERSRRCCIRSLRLEETKFLITSPGTFF